ncbi:MAG: AI-2E family transporter [Gemmatimonadales bacterium]
MSSNSAGSMPSLGRLLLTTAGAIAVLAGMRSAAPILGPVFVALAITIAWSPGSAWLRGRGVRPNIAALTGILLGILVIVTFVALIWSSLVQLQDKLPGYQPRIEAIQLLIQQKLADLPIDTSRLFSSETFQPGSIVGYAIRLIRNLTQTAGNLFLLLLLMAFMMLEAGRYPQKLREALANRPGAIDRFKGFAASIRSYVVINATFGLVVAAFQTILLLALGVDFAILWGVMSFLLSFVPNVGFIIALVPPALLALIEFGFTRSLIVVVGYVVVNFIVDNLIKPRFVGESLDLAPLVVVVSLLFWGWLLGPLGALVAVPLSIAAKVFFESFEESRWLAHLMSDAGPKPVVIDVNPHGDAK